MSDAAARPNGRVIWITGLSAAGKSTIARRLVELLQERGDLPLLLDGDMIRQAIGDECCGHDVAGRLMNAYRISRLAKLAAEQGHIVVVATMSLFHEIHDWNRANIDGYFEVFLDVSIDVARSRDPKQLYQKLHVGLETNMPGMDLQPEFPQAPHLHLHNNANIDDVTGIAQRVVDASGV